MTMMIKTQPLLSIGALGVCLLVQGCTSMKLGDKPSSEPPLPTQFPNASGSTSTATMSWREYFKDPVLVSLIGTALENNQELNILLQEINVSKSEVRARKGAIFPFLRLGAGGGLEKTSLFTRDGVVEDNHPIEPGKAFPEPLPDFTFAADFDWEVDIWRKLRNERDAAVLRYLATQEGRNFMVTNLVAEMAESYYELLALDNQLIILNAMIENQQNALKAVRLQKDAAKVTELAVKRFEAEVAKNQSRLYNIQQQITVTENKLNYLAGRYPQPIRRKSGNFDRLALSAVHAGLPAELLRNRPDVRQAELELAATGLEVKAAGARFYPSLNISAALGLQSFSMDSVLSTPESMIYKAAGEMVAPLVNRSAIKAAFASANARQVAAIYEYQQAVLKAYIDVVNQLAQIRNLNRSFSLKKQQVQALADANSVVGQLFNSARADYTEVLLTQRDALESREDLIELKQQQLTAFVKAYKALGGGYDRNVGDGGKPL